MSSLTMSNLLPWIVWGKPKISMKGEFGNTEYSIGAWGFAGEMLCFKRIQQAGLSGAISVDSPPIPNPTTTHIHTLHRSSCRGSIAAADNRVHIREAVSNVVRRSNSKMKYLLDSNPSIASYQLWPRTSYSTTRMGIESEFFILWNKRKNTIQEYHEE